MDQIKAFWRKVPKPLRSGWITAWVVFTTALFSLAVGLLPALANAITTKNFEPFYDSLSLATTAGYSAALAFLSGLVNAVYRWIRPIEQAYRTDPPGPNDTPRDQGVIDQGLLVVFCVALLVSIAVVAVTIWLSDTLNF
jgi:hypothetical protein